MSAGRSSRSMVADTSFEGRPGAAMVHTLYNLSMEWMAAPRRC